MKVDRIDWDFFIDTGGTFTDCLGCGPNKDYIRVKVLSRGSLSARVEKQISDTVVQLEKDVNWPDQFPANFKMVTPLLRDSSLRVMKWDNQDKILTLSSPLNITKLEGETIELFSGWEAPLLAVRLILARENIAQGNCSINVRLATTRCTNALLEQTGSKPLLFLTAGFSDLLEIGDQRRIGLFDLIPRKRKSFAGPVIEVAERMERDGTPSGTPELQKIISSAQCFQESGYKVAVVSFLNSYINNDNERMVVKELQKIGFQTVIGSTDVHPFIKWLSRCESAVLEAYLYPVLDEYLNNIIIGLGKSAQLLVMNSAGGLIERPHYRAVDSLLSGPAGGVVGACSDARRAGLTKFINLDMGGTSTDVSRFSGSYSYQSTIEIGGAQLAGIALNIQTVAAGGGSVCKVEDGRLMVGPESSGAYPGPACYGFGGPLSLTDVNLLLGRLDENRFPTPISKESAQAQLDQMGKHTGFSQQELLEGFLVLADDSMAMAIRKISVEQGYDPRDHTIVSFGGAGGQHVCGVAKRLGVTSVLSPADSGLLSAYGLSMSKIERIVECAVYGSPTDQELEKTEAELAEQGFCELGDHRESAKVIRKTASVRMKGQESGLEVDYANISQIKNLYETKFLKIFGYQPTNGKIEIYSIRIQIACSDPFLGEEEFGLPDEKGNDKEVKFPFILNRSELNCGESVYGPCLVVDDFGTLWVEKGWCATKGSYGSLLMKLTDSSLSLGSQPIAQAELFKNRFYCLVDEMGAQLKRTALSVNIRERLDFSCALLDRNGYLVANAPHIPVHLGALGVCVRRVIKLFPGLESGDILITNHPGFGGSHLPDITILAPVFSVHGKLLCFLANRAHHSEIGGVAPGSMPAGAESLSDEGVVISPSYLFRGGRSCINDIAKQLSSGVFPSRQIDQNLADISAQVASLRQGLEQMKSLEERYSHGELEKQMEALRIDASKNCGAFLGTYGNCKLNSVQYLDDGDILKLQISIKDGYSEFDFSGTAQSREDNLNATEAITLSAVCYCLRVLIGKELPLNEGLLEPISLIIPQGSILSPDFSGKAQDCPGVAGGNVEISQKLVDLILNAFQQVACSQGTMNNISFGNQSFSHYETIGGGSGAIIGQNGTSAVQVHMTNTAITDPEILESSFPLRLLGFKVRDSSGGSGTWSGGNGMEREYLFEETATLSLLTQNRKTAPLGIGGGNPGQPGEQILIRQNGKQEILSSIESVIVCPGDRLILRTPGGGGVGDPELLA